jgi:prophage antirepressor-like protein
MAILALSFNNVDLTPIDNNDGQIWFTSKHLAESLGYKSTDSITRIYNRYSDEFSESMSQSHTVYEAVNSDSAENRGKLGVTTRIFSLRGCHLIAMFARTKVAKDFRAWVLNVLDRHMAESKLPLSIQQSLNAVHAIRAIEFDKASGYGFGLNKWKGDKKVIDEAEAVILSYLQPELPNLSDKGC